MDMTKVIPAVDMRGDDDEDTALLRDMLEGAKRYLTSFKWCGGIEASYFGLGVGKVIAVFFFRIRPAKQDVDTELWVVVGDVPPAYLVTDQAPNPACALKMYIDLMGEWVTAVREGRPVDELIPVNVAPTVEWADKLDSRLVFLEKEILSQYPEDLSACGSESASSGDATPPR